MRELAQLPTPAIARRILLMGASCGGDDPGWGRPGRGARRDAREVVEPATSTRLAMSLLELEVGPGVGQALSIWCSPSICFRCSARPPWSASTFLGWPL